MWANCASRSGCSLPSRVLRLACRLNFSCASRSEMHGYAEWATASAALWYPHPQEGLGRVLARSQLLLQPFQPSLHPLGFNLSEAHAIHPRRSRIGAAASVGFLQDVLATDLVPKRVEAEVWFSLSFRLQRGLERLNRFSRCW